MKIRWLDGYTAREGNDAVDTISQGRRKEIDCALADEIPNEIWI
jgi:hypothetical protein